MKSETGVQRNRQQEYSVFGNNNATKSETRVQQQGLGQDEDGAVVFIPVVDVADVARLDLIIAHLQHLPEVFFKKMRRVQIIFKEDAHR